MNISKTKNIRGSLLGNLQLILVILFTGATFNLTSQTIIEQGDTSEIEEKVPKSNNFYQFTVQQIHPDTFVFSKIDTTFTPFFNYDNHLSNFNSNLGNHGSATKSLLANDSILTGLNYTFDNLDAFRWGKGNIKFKELSQPYASIMYFNGAQKEEGVELHLSQNIRENWNVGVGYRKISSEGFYVRQRNAINNFYFNQQLKSKNHRYQLIFYGIYNETYNQENGGIQNDTLFTNSPEKISRKGFPVNYTDATNRSRQQEYLLKQRFNFGPTKYFYYRDENDSLYPDSIIKSQIIPRITLEHSLLYQHQEFVYEDGNIDSTNYPFQSIQNGSALIDKTLFNKFDNELGIILRPWVKRDSTFLTGLRLRSAAGFQYGTYEQKSNNKLQTDVFQNNVYLSSSLYNLPFTKHHLAISGKLILAGYNEADFNITGYYSNSITKKIKVSIKTAFGSQRPALLFDQYNTFGWVWNTNLDKLSISKADLNLKIDSSFFKVGIAVQSTTNYTYFGWDRLPRQYSNAITTIRPYVEKLFNLGNFHLQLKGGYQFIDQAGIINLPEIYSHNSLYFEGRLFQSEMLVRLGSDVFYVSNYTADRYNPATKQFYIQNNQIVGAYPWLEPFLMVNVERFYFFARMANATEGLRSYNYLARPGYPLQDRAFKFAIKWTLIN